MSTQPAWPSFGCSLWTKQVLCLLLMFGVQWFGIQFHVFSHDTGNLKEKYQAAESLRVFPASKIENQKSNAVQTSQDTKNQIESCPLCTLALHLHDAGCPQTTHFFFLSLSSGFFDRATLSNSAGDSLFSSSRAPPDLLA